MANVTNIELCRKCALGWSIDPFPTLLQNNFIKHREDIRRIVENHLESDCPLPPPNSDLSCLQDEVRKGRLDTRIVYLSRPHGRVYKFEILTDPSSGKLIDSGPCYEGANETRLNAIYKTMYGGRYKHYATVSHIKVLTSMGLKIDVFDTPFIIGRTPTQDELNRLIVPFSRELNSKLRLYSLDNKVDNFMLTQQGDLLPIDAKFVGSKRSASPRSCFPRGNFHQEFDQSVIDKTLVDTYAKMGIPIKVESNTQKFGLSPQSSKDVDEIHRETSAQDKIERVASEAYWTLHRKLNRE